MGPWGREYDCKCEAAVLPCYSPPAPLPTRSAKPNCKVRLVLVDGDWRVAVNANRNIRAHEELFYDYRQALWGYVIGRSIYPWARKKT